MKVTLKERIKLVCIDCYPAHKIAPIAGEVSLVWSIRDIMKANIEKDEVIDDSVL